MATRNEPRINRRRMLALSAAAAAGVGGLALLYHPLRRWWRLDCLEQPVPPGLGYGPLKRDPAGLLDLPEGFSYRVLMNLGDPMSDGGRSPGAADGTGVFALPDGSYRIVRNHELQANQQGKSAYDGGWRPPEAAFYDPHALGGTTTLVLDRELQVRGSFVSLAGTERNCAGCATPWGTWLSCEESLSSPRHDPAYGRDHGYVFEVDPAATGPARPEPLRALGRFNHEGAAVNPAGGELYMTEDRDDSCLYRFEPERPGDLSRGRLSALRVQGRPGLDTSNGVGAPALAVGQSMAVDWVALERPDRPDDDLRLTAREQGAAVFVRGEGMAWRRDGVVFDATSGGPARLGQIWEVVPEGRAAGRLTLLAQAGAPCDFFMPDNMGVQPDGELLFAEDNHFYTRLIGLSPDGRPYSFAYYRGDTAEELSGVAFAPDQRFMVVSVYGLGATLLVTGPFRADI